MGPADLLVQTWVHSRFGRSGASLPGDRNDHLAIMSFLDAQGWQTHRFKRQWFPIDLWGVTNDEWVAMEVKRCESTLHRCCQSRSQGLFISLHKIQWLHAALACGFDEAVLIYLVKVKTGQYDFYWIPVHKIVLVGKTSLSPIDPKDPFAPPVRGKSITTRLAPRYHIGQLTLPPRD